MTNNKELGKLCGKIDALHEDVRDLKTDNINTRELLSSIGERCIITETQLSTHLEGHDGRVAKISAGSGGVLGGFVGGVLMGIGVVADKLKLI